MYAVIMFHMTFDLWNDVMHAHFVSKVHLDNIMYKMYMHHSGGKHCNGAVDIAPWSID